LYFSEVFSSFENDLEQNSEVFSLQKMIQNVIPRFFLFQKWLGTEFQGFSHPKMVRNGIPGVFLFREMVHEWNSEGFSLLRNGSERNSEVFLLRNGLERITKGFSLPSNGSERTEVFLFRETGGILTELPYVLSCSAFCGIIFCW
jgi:hypothetical protein